LRRSRQRSNLSPKSRVLKQIWKVWFPTVIKTVSEWAEKHRIMTRMSSPYPGQWSNETFPYLSTIMDLFTNPFTRMIVLKWATQSGKTECQLNCIGYIISEAPGPTLIIYPTDKVVKKVSSTRIQPMIENCDCLREKKHPNPDKFKLEEMHFTDCYLLLATSQSSSDLSSSPIEYLIGDELKDWPAYTSGGRGGDPVKYGMDRQRNYPHTRKTMLVSSPLEEDSPISIYFNACHEKIYCQLPCPHCDTYQILKFSQVKWEKGEGLPSSDPEAWKLAKKTARYECEHCSGIITDNDKPKMLSNHRWCREDGSDFDLCAESVGSQLSCLYSPVVTFGDVAHEFLECNSSGPSALMNFKTGWLAEEWKQVLVKSEDEHILKARVDLPSQLVPSDAIALTCGIDVQKFGFWFVVRAWARDFSSWLIHYGFIGSWEDVEALLDSAYPQADGGQPMKIWRAAIDSGGGDAEDGLSMTEQAYFWVRAHNTGRTYRLWATKGSSSEIPGAVAKFGESRDRTPSGKPLPGGLQLVLIDTTKMKEIVFARINNAAAGNGFQPAYLNCDVGPDYAHQVSAEEKRRDKRGRIEWVRIRKDNHLLDAEILAQALVDPTWPGGGINLIRPKEAIPRGETVQRAGSGNNWLKTRIAATKSNWLGR
jgi:phage terminase large subunit GpA-like protein